MAMTSDFDPTDYPATCSACGSSLGSFPTAPEARFAETAHLIAGCTSQSSDVPEARNATKKRGKKK